MSEKSRAIQDQVVIRQARAEDLAGFRELRLEALRVHPEAFGRDYEIDRHQPTEFWSERLHVDRPTGIVVFAAHNERLIGMCGVYRRDMPKVRHAAMIWGVYVSPAWRGRHIASKMIAACTDWARDNAVTVLKLSVNSNNTAAIRCYTNCGFTVYGIDPNVILYNGVMHDNLMMALSIGEENVPAESN